MRCTIRSSRAVAVVASMLFAAVSLYAATYAATRSEYLRGYGTPSQILSFFEYPFTGLIPAIALTAFFALFCFFARTKDQGIWIIGLFTSLGIFVSALLLPLVGIGFKEDFVLLGLKSRVEHTVDLQRLRDWANDVIQEDVHELLPQEHIPSCIRKLSRSPVQAEIEHRDGNQKYVNIELGGGFNHRGLMVGGDDFYPRSFRLFTVVQIAPGVFIYSQY
jgi:hypothetical protein